MLKSLEIKNIATISSLSFDLDSGFNILTGETGAGKSILIDSINLVTGRVSSRELIRHGETSAEVTAVFTLVSKTAEKKLEESQLPTETDGSITLFRRMYKDGKNLCRINGVPVTVASLKEVGALLINIHGQRDSGALLHEAGHIDFLDAYADTAAIKNAYYTEYCKVQRAVNRIEELKKDKEENERRADLLTFRINELENAGITPGEWDELKKKKAILRNSKRLYDAVYSALAMLQGDAESNGADSLICGAIKEINSVGDTAKGMDSLAAILENAADSVSSVADSLEDVLGQLESLDTDTDKLEERLDTLTRLGKKYGDSEEKMLAFLSDCKKQLAGISSDDEELNRLEEQIIPMKENMLALANELHEKRAKAAGPLEKEIEEQLSRLDMPSAVFKAEISKIEPKKNGIDSVRFVMSANKGLAPAPLSKIASGGELARTMLTLISVLHAGAEGEALIFDEIDTGVSGSAATKIAKKLSGLTKFNQVLCITHLAKIASYADKHLFISKKVVNGVTFTGLNELDRDGRISELARITAGTPGDEAQRISAEELICIAEKEKLAAE